MPWWNTTHYKWRLLSTALAAWAATHYGVVADSTQTRYPTDPPVHWLSEIVMFWKYDIIISQIHLLDPNLLLRESDRVSLKETKFKSEMKSCVIAHCATWMNSFRLLENLLDLQEEELVGLLLFSWENFKLWALVSFSLLWRDNISDGNPSGWLKLGIEDVAQTNLWLKISH